jgi:hypothetical protein
MSDPPCEPHQFHQEPFLPKPDSVKHTPFEVQRYIKGYLKQHEFYEEEGKKLGRNINRSFFITIDLVLASN